MLCRLSLLFLAATVTAVINTPNTTGAIDKAFIIKLSSKAQLASAISHLEEFHQQASYLNYTVRHEFNNLDVFSGLSIQVTGDITEEDALTQLQSIPGVISVSPVYKVGLPAFTEVSVAEPLLSSSDPADLTAVASSTGDLSGALRMGGIDKLHALGIKGKGIKIGVIDTGVDYRHPALGAGFGPGFKIAGGYSFVNDAGTLVESADPLASCYGGGHGTHVSGILGMEPIDGSFDITGVAPEASIYMYRVFDCYATGGSDSIVAAMTKAIEDGVDLISMSLGIGSQSFSGATDPLAAIAKKVTDAGIALVIAIANDASGSKYSNELYTAEWPATEPTAIGVGSVANAEFPLVYSAEDSAGATLQYAAVYPVDIEELDVVLIDDGCSADDWTTAVASIKNLSSTIIGFPVTSSCAATSINYKSSGLQPVFLLGYIADTTDPFISEYNAPSRGFYANTTYINLNIADGAKLVENFAAAGGYGKYKLSFGNATFSSPAQTTGGQMDYYSSFGPSWHDYLLKPQISAPGGDILSTWPLGIYGEYTILSGTSMAAPYLAGCYALVKSQFPNATPDEIKARLQTTAKPMSWAFDSTILSTTAQQGAGLVNAYDAIMSSSVISPGEIQVTDVSTSVYGAANITISNNSTATKTYTLSHQGAGYMNYYLTYKEVNQNAKYGSANFTSPTITVAAGEKTTIPFSITPPVDVTPSSLPVFSGFINVASSDETFSVPYIGPPYSLYNTNYILYQEASAGVPLPYVYESTSSGINYNTGILTLDTSSTSTITGNIPTLQWTTHALIHLLPANTSITTNYYGFNQSVTYPYQASESTANSTLFGYPSFGTLLDKKGLNWPGSFSPGATKAGVAFKVTGDDAVAWTVGTGDYRWWGGILRWGGDETKMEDWDTWLSPVIRVV